MIGPLQASTTSLESQESYLTAGMLPYNRNVTLQTFLSSTRDFLPPTQYFRTAL